MKGRAGYTNDTAVETRIIDLKALADHSSEEDTIQELKAVKKDYIHHKSEDHIKEPITSEENDEELKENDKVDNNLNSGSKDNGGTKDVYDESADD